MNNQLSLSQTLLGYALNPLKRTAIEPFIKVSPAQLDCAVKQALQVIEAGPFEFGPPSGWTKTTDAAVPHPEDA